MILVFRDKHRHVFFLMLCQQKNTPECSLKLFLELTITSGGERGVPRLPWHQSGHKIIGPGCQSIPFDGLLLYDGLHFFDWCSRSVFVGLVRGRGSGRAGRVVIGVPGRQVLSSGLRLVFGVSWVLVWWPAASFAAHFAEGGIKSRG